MLFKGFCLDCDKSFDDMHNHLCCPYCDGENIMEDNLEDTFEIDGHFEGDMSNTNGLDWNDFTE